MIVSELRTEMLEVFDRLRRAVDETEDCPKPEEFVGALYRYVEERILNRCTMMKDSGRQSASVPAVPAWSYAIIDSGREFGENPIGQGAVIKLGITVE